MREGKNEVEVVDWQDLFSSFGNPALSRYVLAFGTVPVSAGVIGDAQRAAGITALDAAAQMGSATV